MHQAWLQAVEQRYRFVIYEAESGIIVTGIFRNQIRDYAERLTRALHHPKVLLPTHWDNFERPYEDGAQDLRDVLGEAGALDTFVRELKRASPPSRVVVLDFFETFDF